jgi:hypothetical protein
MRGGEDVRTGALEAASPGIAVYSLVGRLET